MEIIEIAGFFVGVVCAWFLSLALHELGHAIAARLAGLPVPACGIGLRRPFLKGRLGGIWFYAGFPLNCGLTVILPDQVTFPDRRFAFSIAGGPAASLIGSVVAGILCLAGFTNGLIIGTAAISGFFFLITIIPYQAKVGHVSLPTDGAQILAIVKGTYAGLQPSGVKLTAFEAIRELCEALSVPEATAQLTAYIGYYQILLGDLESARATLADPQPDADSNGSSRKNWTEFARATLQLHDNPVSLSINESAGVSEQLSGDPVAITSLQIARAEIALDRGASCAKLLNEASAAAAKAAVPYLQSAVEAIQLESQSPENLYDRARQLLDATGARQLHDLTALRLAATTCRTLAERRDFVPAREMFHDALRRLTAISDTIVPGRTRDRFQQRAALPLRAVAGLANESVPLFIPERSAPQPITAASFVKTLWKINYLMMALLVFLLGMIAGIGIAVVIVIAIERTGAR